MKFPQFKHIFKAMGSRHKVEPPYFHLTQVGDPVLRQRTSELPVEAIKAPEVQSLIQHMISVMRHNKLVGLACNQIGMPYRILTMEFRDALKKEYSPALYAAREMETLPLTVVINAKLTPKDFSQVSHPEGCGSVKGFNATVPRHRAVLLEGLNEHAEKVSLELRGWNARIAQHEVDHLDGLVYTDRMDPKTFCCASWQDINREGGRVTLKYYED